MTTLEVLVERIDNLKVDLNEKHNQNRNSIHKLNGEVSRLNDQIWLLKLKIAGWAGGGSALSVGIMEFLKWVFSHK